jgi:hypothetical protein
VTWKDRQTPCCPVNSLLSVLCPYCAQIGIAAKRTATAIPETAGCMSPLCLPIVLAACGKHYQSRLVENQCHLMAYNFRFCQSLFTLCNFFSHLLIIHTFDAAWDSGTQLSLIGYLAPTQYLHSPTLKRNRKPSPRRDRTKRNRPNPDIDDFGSAGQQAVLEKAVEAHNGLARFV